MRSIDVRRRPASRADLEAWYARVLEAQARSGLSVSRFAARLGVTPATLYQWRRRLGTTSADDPGRPKLVEVTLSDAGVVAGQMVVRLAGGRALEVPPDFSAEALQRLVVALEAC